MSELLFSQIKKVHWFKNEEEKTSFQALQLVYGFKSFQVEKDIEAHHLEQVHGSEIIEAGLETDFLNQDKRAQADGIYTDKKNVFGIKETLLCSIYLRLNTEEYFEID